MDDGVWHGKLTRISDKRELSEVTIVFMGDSMRIFANAVFGTNNSKFVRDKETEKKIDIDIDSEGFVYSNEKCVVQVYANDKTKELHIKSCRPKKGLADNPKWRILATENLAKAKSFVYESFFNKPLPRNVENYVFGKLSGHTFKKGDLQIGNIYIDCHDDIITVKSNALFSNIKLTKSGYDPQKDCFIYKSDSDDNSYWVYSRTDEYCIEGLDFYSVIKPTNNTDIWFGPYVNFSQNVNDYPIIGHVYSGKYESSDDDDMKLLGMMFGVVYETYWSLVFKDNCKAELIESRQTDETYKQLYSAITGSGGIASLVNMGVNSSDGLYLYNYYVNRDNEVILYNDMGKEITLKGNFNSYELINKNGVHRNCVLQRIEPGKK